MIFKKDKNKKDVRGGSPDRNKKLIFILAVIVIVAAAVILGLYIAGYRHLKIRYISSTDGVEQQISFTGFVNKDGSLRSGTLTYETGKASVTSSGEGLYTLNYSNGDVYEGEMDGLQRQGQGKMTYASGGSYEGSFENDRFHGQGVFTYSGGDVYTGSFSGGKKSGTGKYVWAPQNGKSAVYEGSFRADRRNGYGVYTESNGSVYAGRYKDDLREDESAEVIIVTEDGKIDRYYGGYENDRRSGFGYYFYANGDIYVGEFKNNVISGKGTIYRRDGSSYTGQFVDGNIDRSQATLIPSDEANRIMSGLDPNVNPLDA